MSSRVKGCDTARGGKNAAITTWRNTAPTTEPVFGPSPAKYGSFDDSYAGAGQVVVDPRDATTLHMLYEGNNDCHGSPPGCHGPFWATVGIAVARDPYQTGFLLGIRRGLCANGRRSEQRGGK